MYCSPGHLECRFHGAETPQAKKAANARVAYALAVMVEPALEVLHKVLNSEAEPDANTIRVAQLVLDRAGFGPHASIQVTTQPDPAPWAAWLTDEELIQVRDITERARQRMEAGAPRLDFAQPERVPHIEGEVVEDRLTPDGIDPQGDHDGRNLDGF
jgi:hypothetical protein